jgi:CDP-diacylglycerol--glycerol-3-phosphate 3-phosphatidyltransferase
MTQRLIHAIPLLLTSLRIALAPVVVLLALRWPAEIAFAICLIAAFLSDVFDGIIARRLDIATPGLRRLDSAADTIFYLAAVFAVWHLHPAAITERLVPLVVLAVLELARYAFDFAKFGREASYHMWSSKAWGVALFVGFFSVLVFDASGWAVSLAVYLGILADVEGLAISLALRHWKSDVPTLAHALRIRREGAA